LKAGALQQAQELEAVAARELQARQELETLQASMSKTDADAGASALELSSLRTAQEKNEALLQQGVHEAEAVAGELRVAQKEIDRLNAERSVDAQHAKATEASLSQLKAGASANEDAASAATEQCTKASLA